MVDSTALKSGNLLQGMGLSNFSFGGMGTVATVMMWIFISLIVVGIFVAIIVWIVYKRTYNQNIYIYKMLGNKPALTFVDKAKVVRMGSVGDTLFQLRKMKKFIAPPTIQISPNTWWYWQRPDGELINFTLGDIDEQMRKAGVQYVDTDMRMQRLGIEKNLRDRFEKIGFWQKYGATIMGLIFVIMVTISLVVLFSQLRDVSKALQGTAGAIQSMAESVNKFYNGTIGGGANPSGLVPA